MGRIDLEEARLERKSRRVTQPNRGVNDFTYINTRIHAMRGALLKKETLLGMAKAGNLGELTRLLAQTDYGQDIKAAEQKYARTMRPLEVLDDGLKQNCARNINRVRDFTAGEPRGIIDSMFMRWDAYNIVTIFRGKHAGLQAAEITQNMLFLGSLNRKFLEELAGEPDILSVVKGLNRVQPALYRALKRAAEDYASTGHLLDLELMVDKWYYHEAIKVSKIKIISDYLQSSVDIRNLCTVMRFVHSGVGAELDRAFRFYIPGGRQISFSKFKHLLKTDSVENVLKAVNLSDSDALIAKLDYYQRVDDIGVFERVMESRLARSLRRGVVQNPLSFDLTLYFLQAKYNEFINLRLILRAVEFGIPDPVIMEELVVI